jgi:hypothetical protein
MGGNEGVPRNIHYQIFEGRKPVPIEAPLQP